MSDTGVPGPDVDGVYLEKTLRHEPMELSLDDSVSFRAILLLWFRAWFVSFVFFVIFFVLWVLTGGPQSLSGSSGNVVDGGSPDFGLLTVGLFGSGIIFWVLILFAKIQEPIGEWRVLLVDRGQYADSVYSKVNGVLARRFLPIQPRVRRIYADPSARSVKNVLELKEGQYSVYVTVFPYGSSLYLGWNMWRRRSGAAMIWRMVTDSIGSMLGVVDGVRIMLRTDRPRAMREAVHAACREGVSSAVQHEVVGPEYGFPQGLPTIEPFAVTAPASAPVPVGPAPAGPLPGQAP